MKLRMLPVGKYLCEGLEHERAQVHTRVRECEPGCGAADGAECYEVDVDEAVGIGAVGAAMRQGAYGALDGEEDGEEVRGI